MELPTLRRPRLPWGALLGVGLVILLSVGALAWQLQDSRAEAIQQWQARLGAMATDRALGLDRWLMERLGDAQVLAQDLGPEAATPEELALTEEDLALAVAAYGYRAGWLLAPDGEVLAGTEGITPYPGEVTLAGRAMASGEAEPWFFTEPERHVSFAAPLPPAGPVGGPGGGPGGGAAVVLRADPERYLFPFLESEPLPTRTGETLLGRAEGDSVVFLNRLRKGVAPTETLTRPLADQGLAMTAALRGREAFGGFTDYMGAPVLAATRALENAPWGLVVKVDREEALAEHRSQRAVLLLAGLGLVLGLLGGAGAYGSHQRARERLLEAQLLRESEEKHRLLFQQSRDAIFLTSVEGRLVDVNPACAELLKVDPERLEDHEAGQFYLDPDDRERFRRLMLKEGGITDFEVELQDLEGRTFTALYSAAVRRGPAGEVVGFQGTVRDITERKEAEAELRRSRNRLEEAQRIAHLGDWAWDIRTGALTWSEEIYRIFGMEPGQATPTYEGFLERVHPEDREAVERAVDAALAEGRPYAIDHRIVRPDGEVRVVHGSGEVHRDEAGRPVEMVGTVHDVTERAEARQELAASERRFRSLIENASDLISLLDAQGVTRYQSPAFERILGYPEGSLEGVDSFQLIHPDDRDETREAFEDLLRRPGGRAQAEYRFRHANGGWRVLETRAVNLLEDPAVQGVVVNSRDVTERREAEEELERTSTRLQTILDTVTEAVVLVRPEGTIDFANPAAERILGITPSEAAGRRYDDPGWEITAVDGGPFPHEELPFVRVMDTGEEVYDVQHAIERPAGERAIVSINAAPIRGLEGELTGMVASIQDVTERIRAEEEIRRLNVELEQRVRRRTQELTAANEELEAFAYSVSHDLRAPLRALDGFSQALAEDYGDRLDGQALDFLGRIRANSQRMAQLIDDILQLSRVSRKEMERTEVDLVALAEETLEELRLIDPDRDVTFVAPPTLTAQGDPKLLRVVVENLVGNAWKFTEPEDDPVIELGVEPGEAERTYYVRDNGVGFDMEYADKLFKAFHRLHRDSEFEGTGIGLATVSRIVRRHGGDARAEGAVGEGATIWFTLAEDGRG